MTRGLHRVLWPAWAAALLMPMSRADGAFLRDLPLEVRQCDGSRLDVWVTGDESHRTVRDGSGQPLERDPLTGCIGPAFGTQVPTSGRLHPAASLPARAWEPSGLLGTVGNLAIFVRFEGDDEMTERIEDFEDQFNATTPGSTSMRAFFQEASVGAVDLLTVFLPPADDQGWVVAYTDPHSRGYYGVYHPTANPSGYRTDQEAGWREHALLQSALEAVEAMVPADLDLDANDDGFVDNVVFLVDGPPGDPWSGLLWPHMWAFPDPVPFRGLAVNLYNMNFTGLLRFSPGTFAHEMAHTLGAPDLYHYNQDDLRPVGPWDLMEQTLSPPQHPLAYLKWRYLGWIPEPPEVGHGAEVRLWPSWALGTQAVWVQAGPDPRQSFWLEYRRAEGPFEGSLPASGLLVYRVDDSVAGDGNRSGPPDEVYVFRPGGSPGLRGQVVQAPLGADTGRDRMHEMTDPAPFLQDGTPVTLRVYDVREDEAGVTFRVCLVPPDCGDRVCGDDGCGGLCGTCPEGHRCTEGTCEACSCEGRSCGDDGCGVSCGTCDDGNPCTVDRCEAWTCRFDQVPVGSPCDDGDPCTAGDRCGPEGTCQGDPACLPEDVPVADLATDTPSQDALDVEIDGATPPDPGPGEDRATDGPHPEDGAGHPADGALPPPAGSGHGCGSGSAGSPVGLAAGISLLWIWAWRRRGTITHGPHSTH